VPEGIVEKRVAPPLLAPKFGVVNCAESVLELTPMLPPLSMPT
jgi:hypothetical protein